GALRVYAGDGRGERGAAGGGANSGIGGKCGDVAASAGMDPLPCGPESTRGSRRVRALAASAARSLDHASAHDVPAEQAPIRRGTGYAAHGDSGRSIFAVAAGG